MNGYDIAILVVYTVYSPHEYVYKYSGTYTVLFYNYISHLIGIHIYM